MTEEQIALESEDLTDETVETVESVKNVFLLKERFEINFQTPLVDLDTNGATAFDVKDNINPQRNLFALICSNETSPRLSYLAYLKSIDAPNILKLVEYGIIRKKDGEEAVALIYNKPNGPRADVFYETKDLLL